MSDELREMKEMLETLMAEREIQQQLKNYCRSLDRLDGELFKGVWHPDSVLNYPTNQGRAHDLTQWIMEGTAKSTTSGYHQISNSTIKVVGDRAVSETYVHGILRSHPDENGRRFDSLAWGRYLDQWSKRDGKWALDHRELVRDYTWEQEVNDVRNDTGSRRDRDDPSYALFASLDQES